MWDVYVGCLFLLILLYWAYSRLLIHDYWFIGKHLDCVPFFYTTLGCPVSIWSASYHHPIEDMCLFDLLLMQRSVGSGKRLFYQLVEVMSLRILQCYLQGFRHPLSWDLWFLCKIYCVYRLIIIILHCTYFVFYKAITANFSNITNKPGLHKNKK